MDLDALTTGLLTALGLIVAIGAQNAYLLRLGTSAPVRVLVPVIVLCAASDTLLYAVGVAGITTVASLAPWLMTGFQVVAIGFLLVYGFLSLKRATRSEALIIASGSRTPTLWAALGTMSAFTWLNPHVYLDTCVMIGSLAQPFGESKWIFALGAALGSWIWFLGLGLGSRALRPLLAKPWTWRVLDSVIALVMFGIAVRLVLDLFK